ncbi:MAG: hypothetical protein H0S80_00825 [Desulfovibrionaceae bacterium]|nr:hypothetical protein [Desulfovibrionaceae bacterium]
MILATVLTLVMLSPSMAADVPGLAGASLVASSQPGPEKDQPSVLIIKGEGGKVTGVEKGDKGGKSKKKKNGK